jgi:PAS domain S-box-containing protein
VHQMLATYNYRLVVLSFGVAMLASYATVDWAARATALRRWAGGVWLTRGACPKGGAGMLVFPPLVSLSAAILVSFRAPFECGRERMTRLCGGLGGLVGDNRIAAIRSGKGEICQCRREVAVRASEPTYRGVFDDTLVGMFKLGPEGHLLDGNPVMANLLGYTDPEELRALIIEPLWTRAVSLERRNELMAAVRAAGHVRSFELEVSRKDGSTTWISANLRADSLHGALIGFTGSFEDITERRRLREQSLQAQKLQSVGQLAAGIAHEINTPVQYIGDNVRFLADSFAELMALNVGYARLLAAAERTEVTPPILEEMAQMVAKVDVAYLLTEIPRALEQTLEGVSRVSAMVGAMQEFSHPGTGEKVPLNLNRAIENAVAVARNEWKYAVDMKMELDCTLPLVSCLPGDFNQVLLNVIVNAAQAIEDVAARGGTEKGLITIRTRSIAGWAEVRVSDTGGGIPETIRTRIFDPFFTTREIGKGSGQGLAIARSIVVDKHQGTIEFETKVGHGTSFIICLPCAGAQCPLPDQASA